ncbi:hypothetical protein PJK45_23995 [Mycobacterium kansasii]|uniref:Uncharacterized protein n=1 Tax=Mycobacterium kansasii 662 TaxID=1299326 RepID=X7ZS35_MYCKA|nr:hypothetical protein [Mycobacterium kansasii]EUA22039.1 hypothetical protein I545_0511 [Mycobacterium kansasii 662]KEP43398.1 hypothetical protein MKSMC1_14390 [Mycobacterium kansasii]UCA18281.1 hypothetical protein LA359_18880 [Mycobacterium kansasii]UGT83143.1 hypothetical protein LTS70_10925 [Mycobacterium kansasii]UGT87418.1 hypothetical protein LTT71_04320 [Mycobacterium kansasii]
MATASTRSARDAAGPTPALPGHFAFAANRAQSLQAPSASTKPWPPIPVSNQPPENTLRPAISGR